MVSNVRFSEALDDFYKQRKNIFLITKWEFFPIQQLCHGGLQWKHIWHSILDSMYHLMIGIYKGYKEICL